MKKLFLSMVAVLMSATSVFSQNTLVATLTHGESINMYYGAYALRDAMNAAASGDVINLSGGSFQAVNITKAVTLRGTGIDNANPTYILGDYTINIDSDDSNRLLMEGIRNTGIIAMAGTFDSPYFIKSAFYSFEYQSSATIKNALFTNCKITYQYFLKGWSTVQFVNSYISGFGNTNFDGSAATFVNCVILPYDWGLRADAICYSQLFNCILFHLYNTDEYYADSRGYTKLPTTTSATNCLAIGFGDVFYNQLTNANNYYVGGNDYPNIFKTFTGTRTDLDNQTFELSDGAKTTYIGTDGTEVGMYGGLMSYNTTPSYPQITKMNVAKKSTADGKLSVEIEVNAVQE